MRGNVHVRFGERAEETDRQPPTPRLCSTLHGDLDARRLALSCGGHRLADRQCVGWSLAGHRRTELAIDALTMAIGRRRPPEGLIHHSDRGSEYAASDYQAMLRHYKFVASMSRKDNCWDNAVIERFFGTLKSEWLDSQRYGSREQAKQDAIHFIEMEYNSDRDHSSLGYQTPRETELAAVA